MSSPTSSRTSPPPAPPISPPGCPCCPPPAALEATQDRLAEKRLFRELDIPTAPFHRLDTPDQLDAAVAVAGLPAVLKTRRFGYDGKDTAAGPFSTSHLLRSKLARWLLPDSAVQITPFLSASIPRGPNPWISPSITGTS